MRAAFLGVAGLIALGACADEAGPPTPPLGRDAGLPSFPDVGVAPPDAGPPPPAPSLTSVSPRSGPSRGGTRVTLRGADLRPPVEVTFGGVRVPDPVLLDTNTIVLEAPPGVPGAVPVSVQTPGGEAALDPGFTYLRDLELHAVTPAQVAAADRGAVVVTGRGFDADTIVLFDRVPLRGARLVGPERIEGFLPALSPGRVVVTAVHKGAKATRRDLLQVLASPRIDDLAPSFGARAGEPIAILGAGLDEATAVELGGLPAEVLARAPDRLLIETPALPVGPADLVVRAPGGRAERVGAFVALDPDCAGGPTLVGVVPAVVDAGAATLTLVGCGLGGAVEVGGVRASRVEARGDHALEVELAALPVGRHDVRVDAPGGPLELRRALNTRAPLRIAAITPDAGAVLGATPVVVTGEGLGPGVELEIAGVRLADLVVTSERELTGTVVAGAHGRFDVVARLGDREARLPAAFSFTEPFEILQVDPLEGSMAGGALVTVYGRGLEGPAELWFGARRGDELVVENGAVLGVRSASAAAGRVDLTLLSARGGFERADAFEYYDPRTVYGGAWGGPIDGSVNVGVTTRQGDPLPGVVVQLGYDADLAYAAITDARGLATISAPYLVGPQTVTIGQNGLEHVTFAEIDARNLSFIAAPHPVQPPADAPIPPCPEPAEPPLVRGRIHRFKSALDPETKPGWVPIAQITYSDADVFSPNPPEPPNQITFAFADGEAFEIAVVRPGPVAVYAIMGDFEQETQTFIPRRMGVVTGVPVDAATPTEGVELSLDIELDQTLELRLDRPPPQLPGPSANAVVPYLNLGSDGVVPFPPQLMGAGTRLEVEGLPRYSGARYVFLTGAYTGEGARLGAPYSLTIATAAITDAEAGIDAGPFLAMPSEVRPKPSELLEGRAIGVVLPGEVRPDMTSIRVRDVAVLSGCCCLDLNGNGACEDLEATQCGAGAVPYVRWSVFAPGRLESYPLPRMPDGIHAFERPATYTYVVQQASAPRFVYDEFIYNNFSPYYWRSWTFWFSRFLVKEESAPP